MDHSWGVSNSESIHMDPSTSARHVDRSTVRHAGALHKKMADFHKKILSVILIEIDDNVDITGCREYLDESVISENMLMQAASVRCHSSPRRSHAT